jgi:hypothetical protein
MIKNLFFNLIIQVYVAILLILLLFSTNLMFILFDNY